METTILKENQIEINMANDRTTISYEVPVDDEISFKAKKTTSSFLTQVKDDDNDDLQNISTSLTPIHKEKKSFLSRVKNVFSPAPKAYSGNKTKPTAASPLCNHKGNNFKIVDLISNKNNNLITSNIDESMKENSLTNINISSPMIDQNNKSNGFFSLGKQQFQSSLASPVTLESSTPIFCLDSIVSPSSLLKNKNTHDKIHDNENDASPIIYSIKLEDIEDIENSDEEKDDESSLLSCMYPHSSPLSSPKVEIMLDSNEKIQSKDDNRRISLDLCMNNSMYDECLHMPKFSQAELDAFVENAVEKALREKDIELKKTIIIEEEDIQSENNLALQARAFDAEEALLELGDELEKKDKLLVAEKLKFEEHMEEFNMQKIQTKALSHRLQIVETELEEMGKTFKETLITEKVQLREQLEKTYDMLRIADKAKHIAEMDSTTSTLNIIKSHLDEELENSKRKEDANQIALAAAVNDAKQHVYDKVKAQFESGNKEFQKIKVQLKEMTNERDALFEEKENTLQLYNKIKDEKELLASQLLSEETINSELFALLSTISLTIIPTSQKDITISFTKRRKEDGGEGEERSKGRKHWIDAAKDRFSLVLENSNSLENREKSLREEVMSLNLKLKQKERLIAEEVEKVNSKNILIKSLTEELTSTKIERDSQMNATAKLSSQVAATESDAEKLKIEINESADRCLKLRQMNEELLEMLENRE